MTNHKSKYSEVSCDLCGSDNNTEQYKLTHTSIVKCSNCGFCYVSPRVSSVFIQEKLQEWADQDVIDEERLRIAFDPNTLNLYGRYLQWIEKLSVTNARELIDIGCSTGALLTVARNRGWSTKGIELGKASGIYATDQHNLDIYSGSLFDYNYCPESYDAISFTEVIEHLESPSDALIRMREWLKPKGLILITTPNYNALYRKMFGSKWWVINCEDEHIMFFTPETLSLLLDKCGYNVEFSYIRGIDILGIFKHIFSSANTNSIKESDIEKGYFEARSLKEKVKKRLEKIGLLSIFRYALRIVDSIVSIKWLPFYAWGEQIIVIARKK